MLRECSVGARSMLDQGKIVEGAFADPPPGGLTVTARFPIMVVMK
jgi:hypothetical protein